MQGTINPVFTSRQVQLHISLKSVTPFGGLVRLIEFFNSGKLGEVLGRVMPFSYSSPNAIAPEQTLFVLFLSIIAGAQRMAHTDWLRTVRADSGFFDQAWLGFLGERSLPYIIVARMTRTLRASVVSNKDWTPMDEHYSTARLHLKLHGWSKERRFVVIRELEREDKSAVGRRLIEVPGYTYRVFVTNREEDPVELWPTTTSERASSSASRS